MQFSQPSAARQLNKLRTLNLIATHKNLSRADISRHLGLNKVSTSEIVELLIKENLLLEAGARETEAGRRPIELLLNKDAYMVLAVDIGSRNTTIALVNLGGELRRFERYPTEPKPTAEHAAATLIQQAKKFLLKMKDSSVVKGMSISLNGEVDSSTGTVVEMRRWQWSNIPLSYALQRHLKFPIIIENNVHAMALGERWFNAADPKRSYLYVNWGEYIGAAFYSEGKILSPPPLLEHLPVSQSSERCHCGAIGCLDTVASGWALTEKHPQGSTVKQLCTLAEREKRIESSLYEAAEAMGSALSYASTLLRPQSVVIGGGIASLPTKYFEVLKESFQRKISPLLRSNITLEQSTLGDHAGILGTAALALDEFIFRRTLLDRLKQNK